MRRNFNKRIKKSSLNLVTTALSGIALVTLCSVPNAAEVRYHDHIQTNEYNRGSDVRLQRVNRVIKFGSCTVNVVVKFPHDELVNKIFSDVEGDELIEAMEATRTQIKSINEVLLVEKGYLVVDNGAEFLLKWSFISSGEFGVNFEVIGRAEFKSGLQVTHDYELSFDGSVRNPYDQFIAKLPDCSQRESSTGNRAL